MQAYDDNLPLPATPLLGREKDIVVAKELLQRDDVHLLTLVGSGGVGKTRLALQVARELLDVSDEDYADGVWFVSLEPIRDPSLLASAIAQTLGLREASQQPAFELLKAHLRDKRTLLVLDNLEQVAEAATQLAELLATCPHLKILATSRAALRISAEHEFPVQPLALPDPQQVSDLKALSKVAAVTLFLERASAIRPDFHLTDANASAIAHICVRLDGLPLAIELAAARVKLFSPQVMLAHLSSRETSALQLLVGGPHDLPTRQQTLRSTIAWSYDLLTPDQQCLFRCLTVFVGGCTLEAAQAVAGDALLDDIASLLDKSLLRQSEQMDGSPRLGMLETIREFGLEQLQACGEIDAAQRRHAAHYLALAEQVEPMLKGAEQKTWLERLEAEHANLRAALNWALEQGDTEIALRLSGALWRFWLYHGHLSEGHGWLEQSLRLTDAPSPMRVKALIGAGLLNHYQGNYGRAAELLGESLSLSRQWQDKPGMATALQCLGMVARNGGRYDAACAMHRESHAIFHELGDEWGAAWAHCYLGIALWLQGDADAARAPTVESIAIFRKSGDRWQTANALIPLSGIARTRGDYVLARTLGEEAMTIMKDLGDRRGAAKAATELADTLYSLGDYAGAQALLGEGMVIMIEMGDKWFVAQHLEVYAFLMAAQNRFAAAVRFLGARDALRESLGSPVPRINPGDETQLLATLHAQLDEAGFAAGYAEGRAMTLDRVIRWARELKPGESIPKKPAASSTSTSHPTGLTTREIEVLRLVAAGMTDAQIAEKLVISARTVNSHLTSIYRKLNVSSRTAAARYAIDHHLA